MLLRVDGFDYIPLASAQNALTASHLTGGGWRFQPGALQDYYRPAIIAGVFGWGHALFVDAVFGAGPTYTNPNMVLPLGVSATASGVVGARMFRGSGTIASPCLRLYDAVTNAPQLTVSLDAMGIIRLWRGDIGGTLLAASDAGAFDDDRWMTVELKATINTSTGEAEVRVNTGSVIHVVSTNTQATGVAGFDAVSVGCQIVGNAQAAFALDDLYVCDLTGSVNNDFLGAVQVRTQFMAGAGATTDFTPNGAGTNWQAASNFGLDDTTYVSDGVVGDLDTYTVQAVVNASIVHGVQVRGAMRQDDATQITARQVLKAGSTQVTGADHLTNESYQYYFDIWELDPDTGLGWTGTEVNAIQVGPKVEAIA
ncbi:MAG TPA: hypothetical protein VGH15_05880 [Caulobacteraceae bacterium]|jgi:hypothetical protein